MFDTFEAEGFELRVQRTFAHLICAARTWLELGAFIDQTSDKAGDRYALTLLYKHWAPRDIHQKHGMPALKSLAESFVYVQLR
jgi:hypothetical protein